VVLAGVLRCPSDVPHKCECTELAGGILAIEVGEGSTAVVGVYRVVAVTNEVEDVLGGSVLRGGDSNGDDWCERHCREITCQ